MPTVKLVMPVKVSDQNILHRPAYPVGSRSIEQKLCDKVAQRRLCQP
jgi:hypothetical protein